MSQDDETRRGAGPAAGADPSVQVTVPARGQGPRSEREDLPFGGTIGRYLVLSVLGHGGMGVVYSAYDPVLDRRIAVKLLRVFRDEDGTEGRTRMHREAQALARLSHHNVITVHDVDEYRGAMYIAMELVDGKTLADWQRDKPWRAVLETYARAARGLAAAHAAGLIHRDFKPENVLVGDDGRVRVTDFGLARLAASEPEAMPLEASPTSQLAGNLTADGAVMGTPRYMAPEQIEGGAVDARTDQFSWCIALWEALYGEQPYPSANLALRAAAMKSEAPKVPASSTVPRSVGRILARGLAVDPGERWPSIEVAVDELLRVTAPRRMLTAGLAAIGMATVAVVFVIARHDQAVPAPTCEDTGAAIDSLWSAEAKEAVATSFYSTKAPFAIDALASLDRSIVRWRDRWRAQALESCRATRVSGTQSQGVLELRSACLARRRDELQATIAALGHADKALVENARTLRLPDLETCTDVAVLAGTTPPPRDPAKQRERSVLEAELSAIETELVHGLALERARELEQVGTKLEERAVALGWAPLVSRARQALAAVQRELGRGKAARVTLLGAAASASAANDVDRLVAVYLELSDVEARLTSEYALGDSWATLAESTLARLGPRTDKQLRVHRQRALVAVKAGRLEDAKAANEAALALARTKGANAELEVLAALGLVEAALGDLAGATRHLERAHAMAKAELGAAHPKLASIEHDLGTVAYRRARYRQAEKHYRDALAVREQSYGADSIEVATTVEQLGIALLGQGRLAEAQPHLDRALHIFEQRLGPEHPDVANALNDIGGAYHRAGEYERELETGKRALAIREAALGPDHPDVGQSLVNTAIASKALGRWDIVLPNYRRAIAIFARAHGPAHLTTAITRLNFAEALRVQNRLADAGREYEAARIVFAKQFGEDHPLLAHIWNGVGQLELARGRTSEAIPLLERAVSLREKDPGDQPALAESRFALARALGKASARAKLLAAQARDGYRAAGKSFGKQVTEIEAWLR